MRRDAGSTSTRIVAGRSQLDPDEGFGEAEAALEQSVRAEVAKEFEPRIATAGRWRRVLLRWRMASEVRRRLGERLFARPASPAHPERAGRDRSAQ